MDSKIECYYLFTQKSWKDIEQHENLRTIERRYLHVQFKLLCAIIEKDKGVMSQNNICFKMADTC